MLSVLVYIVLLVATLLLFVVMCVVWLFTAPFDSERVVMHFLSRMWTDIYFGIVPAWRRKVRGLENIDKKQAYVVIVNHRSMLDIPLMYALPLNFKWVSKREVYKWPLFGIVLRLHGDITIDRNSSGSLRKMIADGKKRLERGTSVIIFPEGTRGRGEGLGRFREGAFLLAREAGVPVLPCVSTGSDTAHNGWRVNFSNRFRINVLPPIDFPTVEQTPPKELAAMMQETMDAEYRKMKNEK